MRMGGWLRFSEEDRVSIFRSMVQSKVRVVLYLKRIGLAGISNKEDSAEVQYAVRQSTAQP